MLSFIVNAFRHLNRLPGRGERDAETCQQWFRDPLSHPALEAMNERELADLPFRR